MSLSKVAAKWWWWWWWWWWWIVFVQWSRLEPIVQAGAVRDSHYREFPTHCEVAKQLYWNHTSAWVFSCKFCADFQDTFSSEHLWTAASRLLKDNFPTTEKPIQNVSVEINVNINHNHISWCCKDCWKIAVQLLKNYIFWWVITNFIWMGSIHCTKN